MKVFFLFALSFFLLLGRVHSQVTLYEDNFHGGITAGGYTPNYFEGGTGTFNIYIEPGSSIHKAYLMSGRHGPAPADTVTLNGIDLVFNNSNQVSPSFNSIYGGTSGVHAIDVTNLLDSSVLNYTLVIPNEGGPSNIFYDFYLYVAYSNPSLPTVNTAIYLNTEDFQAIMDYTCHLTNPVEAGDFGISLFSGYICNDTEPEEVFVNGTSIGSAWGPDYNSGNCGGPIGSFYYQNSILTGTGDDDANLAMANADALSNAATLIPLSSDSVTLSFHGNSSNAVWGVILTWPGVCTTPNASAGNDTTVCQGNTFSLHATGGNGYHWSPTTGLSNPDIANPFATVSNTTTFTVIVTNGSCADSDSVVITANSGALLNPGNDLSVCTGQSVTLNASGCSTYLWSPTTGLSSATIPDPVVNPAANVTYHVTGFSGSCSNTDSVIITIVSMPVAFAGTDTTVCAGVDFVLHGSGGAAYSWGPTTGLSNPNTAQPIANLSMPTVFSLVASNGSCSDIDTVIISVISAPLINAGNDSSICLGDSITLNGSGCTSYNWSPASSLSNPSLSDPVAGPTTTTRYTVVGTNGICAARDSVLITVNLYPVAHAGNDIAVCRGDSIQLNASGGTDYTWSPTPGISNPFIHDPYLRPSQSLYYFVSVSENNCATSDSIFISLHENPTVEISGDTIACSGTELMFIASGASTYTWNNGATSPAISVTPTVNTVYVARGMQQNCYGTDSISVHINSFAKADFEVDSVPCNPALIFSNSSTGSSAFLWDMGDGTSETSPSPVHLYKDPGQYSVTLLASTPYACNDSLKKEIEVSSIHSEELVAANVFTPNNDNINDRFFIGGMEPCSDFTLKIFNRWGNLVFETSDLNTLWDGKTNGKDQSGGVYFYVLTSQTFRKTGTVTLSK